MHTDVCMDRSYLYPMERPKKTWIYVPSCLSAVPYVISSVASRVGGLEDGELDRVKMTYVTLYTLLYFTLEESVAYKVSLQQYIRYYIIIYSAQSMICGFFTSSPQSFKLTCLSSQSRTHSSVLSERQVLENTFPDNFGQLNDQLSH